jgi:hypothetical protein
MALRVALVALVLCCLGGLVARDGEFDVVGCGPGRDRVVADRGDLVGVDCERVSRAFE